MNAPEFILWERASRDSIDFKKVYADLCGDVLAGLMLSEIIYWHLPDDTGKSRLRVKHEGQLWIAVRRYEWWDRTRLSPRQADRALELLLEKQYVIKKVFKFEGETTTHVRMNWEHFLGQHSLIIQHPVFNPFLPANNESVNREYPFSLFPVTKDTTEVKEKDSASVDAGSSETRDKPETPQAHYKRMVFDPIFDALELHFWQTDESNGAFEESEDHSKDGGRIAKLAWWHCGKKYKGIRKIGMPATEENVSQHLEAIARFASWIKTQKLSLHDLQKYVEWYGKWFTDVSATRARKQQRQANAPTREESEMTPEQLERQRAYLAAQTKGKSK